MLSPSLGLAAEPAALTWEQAVARAVAANPELRAGQQALQAAEYQLRGAGAGFLPELSGSLRYSEVNDGGTGVTSTEPTRSAALTAKQNLFAGFRDQASVEQAQANRMRVQADLQIIKARVSADLKSGFAALRFAQDSVQLTQDIIRRREENLRLVELRFEGGRENKGSYFLSKAALDQARFDNLQARHAVRVAQERLAKAMAWEHAQALRVAGQVAMSDPPEAIDLRALLEQVPEHRQAVADVEAAAAGIRLARAGLLPSLDVTASTDSVKEESAPSERRDTVSLQLSVPIYSGGRDYYATQGAAATHAAALDTLADSDRQIMTRLQQSYSDFVQAVEKLAVDRSFLEAATVRAEIARNRYNNGLMSFEDWDIIENDLINRQKTVLQSERDRVVAEAGFEQARGSGVIP